MAKRKRLIMLAVLLYLLLGISQSGKSFARDKELTPEDVVSEHIKSIGPPEVLESIKSRYVHGISSLQVNIMSDYINSHFTFVSEGQRVGMVTKYAGLDYPGEHLAFDGTDVTVGYVAPEQRSRFGEAFIRNYSALMKEGFLGGVLSVAWPLLDLKERNLKLEYKKSKIEGRDLHEITYRAYTEKGRMIIEVKLFFDFETFRHVRTEYGSFVEQFDDFREVDGMMLPHKYSIKAATSIYSSPKMHRSDNRPPIYDEWLHYFEVRQCFHNAKIDPKFFRAQ